MADASAPVNTAGELLLLRLQLHDQDRRDTLTSSFCQLTEPNWPRSPVTAGDNATAKNPFADTPSTNHSDAATPGVSKPLAVTPEAHKPSDTPAATTNGSAAAPAAPADSAINGNGVNGSGPKLETLVPEETKQTSAPAASAAAEAPATSSLGASAPSSSSTSAQPPVMTGALPEGDHSNPKVPVTDSAESNVKDGVEDVTGAKAVPKPADPSPSAPADSSAPESSGLNGEKKDDTVDNATSPNLEEKKDIEDKDGPASGALTSTGDSGAAAPVADPAEKKDVEMKDAAPIPASEKPSVPEPAPAPVTAPVIDTTGTTSTTGAPTTTPALVTPSTAAAEATGDKRKAPADAEEPVGEPAVKKQKGAFSKAMDKAKEAVKDVKERAKPGRKPGKREKKEVAPVGRTERKTRSQARAE
ncbi:hypothetical protein N0V82_000240 [Gnomoniopsis sp. IMI 355080]|nr:hypothetical protein N0V82_000240 [Gnomoniopsis sp. IMI 355080]